MIYHNLFSEIFFNNKIHTAGSCACNAPHRRGSYDACRRARNAAKLSANNRNIFCRERQIISPAILAHFKGRTREANADFDAVIPADGERI